MDNFVNLYIINLMTELHFWGECKKTLEPPKWGEDLGNYSCYIEGIYFDNLSYEQFKILAPFSD